ncbi:MAG: translational GTPase TypA [Clostridiales bacterium]|nr:translational GTPase TypA [Clostridiales bacterium]MDD7432322.1 translational GTPase TypA [Clostridiales bacterium]MDY3061238.1 translational GTPase TypA [Eubacteriales bacterium]
MKNIRDIAIIAHVDHGKTTLVDAMLKQSGIFRQNQEVRTQLMDSNDIERERGITIMAKNTAISYKDTRINIVDTPGHADFGGEVERVLKMVDGVLLLVDAYDGPMPQTRFVLRKALEMDLVPIVVINKIDRPDARPDEVADLIYELFMELGASDRQIDFPIIYCSGKDGAAFTECPENISPELLSEATIFPLLDCIIDHIPEPKGDPEAALQILVSNIDYDSYIGRIAIGRVERGTVRSMQQAVHARYGDELSENFRIGKVLVFEGLNRRAVDSAPAGEIVCMAGIDDVNIGDSICDPEHVEPLPFVDIDEPTIAMTFSVNDSPLAGKEGHYVTSRQIRERLEREMHKNVAMRLENTDTTDAFIVKGRGELQISILIEEMRREGYEFQVSRPHVITKLVNGEVQEPEELLMIDVGEAYSGVVIEKLGKRKAEMISMLPPHKGSIRMEFRIPSRCLIGYRSEFLTDTRGTGIMNSILSGFVPWKGGSVARDHGVLVAFEDGLAVTYGLHNAQDRGRLFIGAGEEVYEGMIVGETMRGDDIPVNVCKAKHVSNMRSSGSDEALRLSPPVSLSLEQCLEFIDDDELIEVTPQKIRMRKRILNTVLRQKADAHKKQSD